MQRRPALILSHGVVLLTMICRGATVAAFQRHARSVSVVAGRQAVAPLPASVNAATPRPPRPVNSLARLQLSSSTASDDSIEPSTGERQQSSKSKRSPRRPWYSDPNLSRDKSRVVKVARASGGKKGRQVAATSDGARFALFLGREAYHISIEDDGGEGGGRSSASEPLFLTYEELKEALGEGLTEGAISEDPSSGTTLAWIGEKDGLDYWALRLPVPGDDEDDLVSDRLTETVRRRQDLPPSSPVSVSRCPLREVGDGLESASDAAVLATANGLLEFHATHAHCSRCGSITAPANAGRSRRCTNDECRTGVYPRIDAAAIMLVTSPCGDHALLGRKENWPRGRYSTLAGFAEVGETLEECCARETLEESGVAVDPASVEFVASQPWPFPRSLMVGFRAVAEGVRTGDADGASPVLPEIDFCEDEMEDVRWFHRDYVAEKLKVCEGSTALTYKPTEEEAEFHVPGKASLARLLILEWVADQ